MAIKVLIFIGLVAATFAYTLPEETQTEENKPYYVNPGWIDLERNGQYYDGLLQEPVTDDEVALVRKARSPQRLDTRYSHSRSGGSSATLEYTHPISKNWEAYAQGSRNFKFRDSSAHAGLRFKF